MAVTRVIELFDCKSIDYSYSVKPLIANQNWKKNKMVKRTFEILMLKVG